MISAVIVAAGKGLRMNADVPKQYLLLDSKPVLQYPLDSFNKISAINKIVLVIPKNDVDYCQRHLNLPAKVTLAAGGATRQESVYNGLLAAKGSEYVLIHDGVRPFVSPADIQTAIESVKKFNACIFAVPAIDTLKEIDDYGNITATLNRQNIRLAQTPQAFQYDIILRAHQEAIQENFTGTDDAALAEKMGVSVKILEGRQTNIKITTAADLRLAEAMIDTICQDL